MRKIQRLFKSKKTYLLLTFVLLLASTIIYHTNKKLPQGLSYEGQLHQAETVRFLHDLTYQDASGEQQVEQEIFPRMLEAIDEAEEFVILDMFLYNDYRSSKKDFPQLTKNLTDRLLAAKNERGLDVHVITDQVNLTYGAHAAEHFQKLSDNGIEVTFTELEPLRDSNPLYSSFWRIFLQWFGQSGEGWLPNPMAENAPKVTLRSYLELMNIKANHRKVLITEKTAIVSSANAHDESGFHSNIAIEASGPVIGDLLKTEQAILDFSGGGKLPEYHPEEEMGQAAVQVLTEGKILKKLIEELDASEEGDTIWIGMFYLADRNVIDAIDNAADRGATVRMILDPNTNAFGNKKAGLPNVPIAAEFERLGLTNVETRWYNTAGEQYHTKLIFFERGNEAAAIGGSANFTRRNLDDLNPETDLFISGPAEAEVFEDMKSYFKRLWENEETVYTLPYEEQENPMTLPKYVVYWLQKIFHFTTF